MNIKEHKGVLRYFNIEAPEVISNVPGIKVFGKLLKSFIFTTDAALIRNTNADAVMAVYPFAAQPVINKTLITAADMPVFCGIGGINVPAGRVVDMAKCAENDGALGVVANAYISDEELSKVKASLDIPIVVTVMSQKDDIERRIETGADILNVSGAAATCSIVESIKNRYPYMPIIATGGPTDESIMDTINCGADAISFTPPSNAEIFKKQMKVFREDS